MLGIRSVAFLLLISSFFTICNRGSDLVASISQYTNTNTTNILNYYPNSKQMIAHERDANLTSAVWIQGFNSSHMNHLRNFNMTAVCSISKDFSLFYSYSIWQKETLDSVSSAVVFSPELRPFIQLDRIQALCGSFNLFSQQYLISGITYEYSILTVYARTDEDDIAADRIIEEVNVNHQPLKTCSEPGLSLGAIVGITVGVIAMVMSHARCLYNGVCRKKKTLQLMHIQGSESSGALAGELASITVDKAVEFSYEELSRATNDFSLGNKIGQGGFGVVYYAELRGEKAAIKKMDMQASKEFLAELNVLTHVHHLNLVRLIGYCVEGSHFLVYEYIENGNLSQHLHGSVRDPIPWSTRVQIALDSARGLEYIHEYTVSVFIHCDIKSANILIDKNFHGKVADFGLTRLTEVGSRSRLMGTFGYMPLEYAQYGDVSPKVDAYAFGVVLYELISGKKAIIRANGSVGEPKGLVSLFDEVLNQADLEDGLVKMIDPRLGDNYPLDSVHKMAQLAKACTHEDPKRRPHMRSIVLALMTLSSSTEDS